MRSIYDYKDIRRLEESTIFNRLEKGLIITATGALSAELSAYYPKNEQNYGLFVMDIHEIVSRLVQEWDSNVKDIKNHIYFRNVIEDYIELNDLTNETAAYLRRNSGDMWNAIVLLIEADVYPDDIPDDVATPVKYFKELWKRVEEENSTLMAFRAAFLYSVSQSKVIEERLGEDVLGKELFLLGFYFITPIQQRIIDSLEQCGFKISYLNSYDKQCTYIYEIWRSTFKEEYEAGVDIDIQPHISAKNIFTKCIEGTVDKSVWEQVEVHEYSTDIEFATACIKAFKTDGMLYSADAKRTEDLLKEFFPELYDNKHLLSYPVGQYIYYLHLMWDEMNERLRLDFDSVFKCFASGWLEDEEINGKEYLYELKTLQVYFRDCHEVEEWEVRLESLEEAKNATSIFTDLSRNRWDNMLSNPFHNIGVYQVKTVAIKSIIQLIQRLIKDAELLFPKKGDNRKSLYVHMQNIKAIIETKTRKEVIAEEEKFVVQELLHRIDSIESSNVICHFNSIKDAILLLIGGNHAAEEGHEEETALTKRMVKPLAMIEAVSLANYGQDIHIVMTDEFSLPGKPRVLPWPLTHELIVKILNVLPSKRYDTINYIKAMERLIETRPLANRYLFHTVFESVNERNEPKIHLSWINKQGEKDVAPSPYISLLGWYEEEHKKNQNEEMIAEWKKSIEEICFQEKELPEDDIKLLDEVLPIEVISDYALCKMRYWYSYILNNIPSYKSEFHYQFALSKIIAAIASVSGEYIENVENHVFELFPFLRRIQLRQSADFAHNRSCKGEPYNFEGIQYPDERIDIHYLKGSVRDLAERTVEKFITGEELGQQLTEDTCRYCPYSEICRYRYIEEAQS